MAYPLGSGDMRDETGLTIREHFAAMAMWSPRNPHNSMDHEAAADWARIEAEALITALEKARG